MPLHNGYYYPILIPKRELKDSEQRFVYLTAGEDISIENVLYFSSNKAYKADASMFASSIVSAVALESATTGNLFKAIVERQVVEVSFPLISGKRYFLESSGSITLDPSEEKHIVQVGIALTNSSLLFDPVFLLMK